jgi:hypothetical protein
MYVELFRMMPTANGPNAFAIIVTQGAAKGVPPDF